MIKRFSLSVLLLLAGGRVMLPLGSAQVAAENGDKSTNVFHPVTPGPADGRIAFVTAGLLQQNHYLRQKFDDTVSSKFLDRFLESLDPQHLHFIQADLAQFERYRTTLDDLTLNPKQNADTRPA